MQQKGAQSFEIIQQTFIWYLCARASLVAQTVKNSPAVHEMRVDPWVRKIPWKREWLPTPVFLPGEFHGQRSLVGYSQSMVSQRVGQDSD